jgi:hypothetical protein
MQSSTPLPPRLSSRILLGLYGVQRPDSLQQLLVQRKKLLVESDNSDVTKPLTFESFLYPSITPDEAQRVKRIYLAFLKEVAVAEAGNAFPNAAKTMYTIIARHWSINNSSNTPQISANKEASSYFGPISETQFDVVWKLADELLTFTANSVHQTINSTTFGSDLVFSNPFPAAFETLQREQQQHQFVSVFDSKDTVSKYLSGSRSMSAAAASSTTPATLTQSTGTTAASAAGATDAVRESAASKKWLLELCLGAPLPSQGQYNTRKTAAMEAAELLAEAITKACELARAEEEEAAQRGTSIEEVEGRLQMSLFDICGEEGFELMLQVMQHRWRIASINKPLVASKSSSVASATSSAATATAQNSSQNQNQQSCNSSNNNLTAEDAALIAALQIADEADGLGDDDDQYFDVRDENLSANQRRKREQKREREAAARAATLQQSSTSFQTSAAASGAAGGGGGSMDWLSQLGFDDEYLAVERALGLQKGKVSQAAQPDNWRDNLAAEGTTSELLEKRGLPTGTERTVHQGYEEVFMPASKRLGSQLDEGEALVDVTVSLEPWAQKAFKGIKTLNRIQSKVFPTAYHSSENMLVQQIFYLLMKCIILYLYFVCLIF